MKATRAGLVLFLLTLMVALMAGCATGRQVEEDLPETIDTTAEVEPAEPDAISFLEVRPWTLEPGNRAQVTVGGTGERTVNVTLEGMSGEAQGESFDFSLDEGEEGRYIGEIVADENLPPGRYRLQAELSGGPTGEPVTLVSDRALTIEAPPPPPDPCMELAQQLQDTPPEIHFEFDKSGILPEDEAYVENLASQMGDFSDRIMMLRIVGHADERGTIEYNLALGARRANSVREALQEAGVEANIETVSKGEEDPLVPNATTEAEHARNRRAELYLECRPRG
jgi:peptidoglycan-associated lipoprotein